MSRRLDRAEQAVADVLIDDYSVPEEQAPGMVEKAVIYGHFNNMNRLTYQQIARLIWRDDRCWLP